MLVGIFLCWIKFYFILLQVFYKILNSVVENVLKFSIFFMVIVEDRDEVVEFCQKNEFCDLLYVIVLSLDKMVFYDMFNDIFERNMVIFLRDINVKVLERYIYEIEFFFGKL